MPEPCIYEFKIAEIATSLDNLKDNFNDFKANDFHEVKENLKCITNKMAKPRLPIYITWLLTACSALIAGLIVAMVKK